MSVEHGITCMQVADGTWVAIRENAHLWQDDPDDTTPGQFHVIDVSHWQEPGDYDLEGVDGVYVRATYGQRPDKRYAEHVQYCRSQGVRFIGAYHFFRQSQDPTEQYTAFRETVRSGGRVTLAPALDFEWGVASADKPTDPDAFNTHGQAIARWMREDFGACLLYMPVYFWRDVLGAPDWTLRYMHWLPHYRKAGWPALVDIPGPDPIEFWAGHQYQGAPLDRSVFRYLPLTSPPSGV